MNTQCPAQIGGANVVAYAIMNEENSHTKNTTQIVAGETMAAAKAMVIAQYEEEENFYVFGVYSEEWAAGTDTWHEDIVDAIEQLDWEYVDLSKNLVWMESYNHLKNKWESNRVGGGN
jgi:hypothetical protein